jgi:hypothetical protein
MTPLHRQSKSDTVLLLDAAVADIFVDLGPERTSLDDLTTWIEESPSPRAALGAPRNVAMVVSLADDDTGILLHMGDAVGFSYRILVTDGVITVYDGSSLECEMPSPSETPALVLIHWSTRIDGTSIVNELAIYNFTSESWAFASATHAGATQNPAHTLTIGAGFGGSTAYSRGLGAILAVHIGRRFHATTEAAEDWVSESTPPAFDGYDRTPMLTGAAAALAIAGEGNFAGPSLLWSGAATRQATQRQVGSFVNARPTVPATEYFSSYPPHFYRASPDGAPGWKLCIRYLWHGYLSPKVNVAQVRAHIRGLDLFSDGDISPIRFRSFSIADLDVGIAGPAMTFYRGPIVSVTSTTPAGEWLDLGVVRLARGSSGLSYFALGFFVDATEDEGMLYTTAWQMKALTVDPYAKDLETGGYGDVDEKAAP